MPIFLFFGGVLTVAGALAWVLHNFFGFANELRWAEFSLLVLCLFGLAIIEIPKLHGQTRNLPNQPRFGMVALGRFTESIFLVVFLTVAVLGYFSHEWLAVQAQESPKLLDSIVIETQGAADKDISVDPIFVPFLERLTRQPGSIVKMAKSKSLTGPIRTCIWSFGPASDIDTASVFIVPEDRKIGAVQILDVVRNAKGEEEVRIPQLIIGTYRILLLVRLKKESNIYSGAIR